MDPSFHASMRPRLSLLSVLFFAFIFLHNAVLAEDKCASDYYVRSLPGQPDGPLLRMHAGHIEVTPEHHGNLFFWRFENRHLANRHRTVLWLNGGPGCSSEDGALMEIGPYRLKDADNLKYNDGSWDEFANLLFVDNPVGTGFSYVDTDSYIHELETMADNMVTFLEKYFKLFPEEQGNDLFIAGESYSGQHIPYIARAILNRNKKVNANAWNLKGLIIGNGWISPREQGLSYLQYAYEEGLVEKGSSDGKKLDELQAQCKAAMDRDSDNDLKVQYNECEAVLTRILRVTQKDGRCYNMYDIRKDDTYPSCGMNWPPDLEYVTPYLRKSEVTNALHINSEKKSGWTECSGAVGGAFTPTSVPSINFLPEILAQIPVLLFSGDRDLICNHIGTEEMIKNMEWNGGKGFETSPGQWAPRRDWTFEDEPAGFYQQARNLTYVLFYNSSHMVPFDYARRSRDMLDRFMGVDIGSIGGKPASSKIDGQKGVEVSVGGHPNSTAAEQEKEQALEEERWSAYYRSGAVALVVVAILAAAFGWYVWQDRKRRAGYRGIADDPSQSTTGLMRRDVEAADFDEEELDDLTHSPRPGDSTYSLGNTNSDVEDEIHGEKGGVNGHPNGERK